MQTIYLSRSNLLSLLNKLDRKRQGQDTACQLNKHDTIHPKYPCSDEAKIFAVEDEEYYTDREPGEIHPAEECAIAKAKAIEKTLLCARAVVALGGHPQVGELIVELDRALEELAELNK